MEVEFVVLELKKAVFDVAALKGREWKKKTTTKRMKRAHNGKLWIRKKKKKRGKR